jgi:hypothetical protein
VYRFRASAASVAAAVGVVLAAVALLARGGNDIGRMAVIEITLVLVAGAIIAAAVLLLRRDGPAYGSVTLTCFAAFTAVTALSMTWSIAPDDTLVEIARSFAYLAIFAAAVTAARLAPTAAPAVLKGILLAATVVVLYALSTRVWPAGEELGARLGEPYDYWNALGATAALAVVPALWLGTTESDRSRPLAFPILGLLILTLLLTESRGALAAAALAVIVWLAVVPRRLSSLGVLVPCALLAAPVAAWALSKDAFTEAMQPLSAREAVAGEFGLLILVMVLVLVACGFVAERVRQGRTPSLPLRRRLGVAAAAAVCVVPLLALTAVATSDRGLSGTLSDRVDEVTDVTGAPPEGAARLGSVSSSRGSYWREAKEVFQERPLRGSGAGTFGTARLPHRENQTVSRHAHGFFAQTIADTGLIGLAAALALLAAWVLAAARATGFGQREEGTPLPAWSDERAALCGLALCAIAFGLHSVIDWTWFVPGPSAMALVAAGFVAGRAPLPPLGATTRPRATTRSRPEPVHIVAAVSVLLAAGICAWAVWQPEASARANDRAFERVESGDLKGAAEAADHAREVNPYSPEPLYAKAAVLAAAGRDIAAYRTLERAVIEHPRDPRTWLRLGTFELETLDLPQRAIATARGAFRVDPHSRQAALLTERANAALGLGAPQRKPPRRDVKG